MKPQQPPVANANEELLAHLRALCGEHAIKVEQGIKVEKGA